MSKSELYSRLYCLEDTLDFCKQHGILELGDWKIYDNAYNYSRDKTIDKGDTRIQISIDSYDSLKFQVIQGNTPCTLALRYDKSGKLMEVCPSKLDDCVSVEWLLALLDDVEANIETKREEIDNVKVTIKKDKQRLESFFDKLCKL